LVKTMAAVSERILLFVKAPVPGEVKTRLAPALGAEKAAALYRMFVLDLLHTLSEIKVPVTVLFHPERYEGLVSEWLGQGLEYLAQEGDDLGQRLRSAFSQGFEGGAESLLALGGDTPDIPGSLVLEAFSSLEEYPSVLIPAIDGGYAAIGFTREGYCPEVFRGIPWGTSEVFRKTLDILAAEGVQARTLSPWQDVDTPRDLDDLVKRLGRSKLCQNVRDFLKAEETRRK
jgi:rSAM/selenodomain-associated transferase 1